MLRIARKPGPTAWRTDGSRPRVLIEHHDASVGVAAGNLLAAEGYEVATCTGPMRRFPCPMVEKGRCERVDQADVVVFGFEVEDEEDRGVLAALKAQNPGVPIVIEIPPSRVPFYKDELEGCVAVPRPMTRESLLDAVERALR